MVGLSVLDLSNSKLSADGADVARLDERPTLKASSRGDTLPVMNRNASGSTRCASFSAAAMTVSCYFETGSGDVFDMFTAASKLSSLSCY